MPTQKDTSRIKAILDADGYDTTDFSVLLTPQMTKAYLATENLKVLKKALDRARDKRLLEQVAQILSKPQKIPVDYDVHQGRVSELGFVPTNFKMFLVEAKQRSSFNALAVSRKNRTVQAIFVRKSSTDQPSKSKKAPWQDRPALLEELLAVQAALGNKLPKTTRIYVTGAFAIGKPKPSTNYQSRCSASGHFQIFHPCLHGGKITMHQPEGSRSGAYELRIIDG